MSTRNRVIHIVSGGLILLALWALLSGKWDAFHLGIGALFAFIVSWVHFRLPSMESGATPFPRFLRLPFYLVWLIGQMLASSFLVAGVILRPRKNPPDPRLIAFESQQPSLVHGMLFANSITLTPGTLTLDYQEGNYLVHALTPGTAGDLLEGEMSDRIARLSPSAEVPTLRERSAKEWRVKQ